MYQIVRYMSSTVADNLSLVIGNLAHGCLQIFAFETCLIKLYNIILFNTVYRNKFKIGDNSGSSGGRLRMKID